MKPVKSLLYTPKKTSKQNYNWAVFQGKVQNICSFVEVTGRSLPNKYWWHLYSSSDSIRAGIKPALLWFHSVLALQSSSCLLVSQKLLHWPGVCWVCHQPSQRLHTQRTSSQIAHLKKHLTVRKMRREKSSSVPLKPFWSGCVAWMNCPLRARCLYKERGFLIPAAKLHD